MDKFFFRSTLFMGIAAIVVGLIVMLTAPADAANNSRRYAAEMNCRVVATVNMTDSPKNSGVKCKVGSDQTFYIVKYENPKLALAWYGKFLKSQPGTNHLAWKGSYFFIPDGGPKPYTKKWANYAANRVGGVVIRG